MIRTVNDWFCRFFEWIGAAILDTYNFSFAIIISIIGYFSPIANAVHLVLFFFFVDIVFGVWASKKVRKQKFQTKIIWQKSIPRAFMSLMLIMCAYMWDTTFSQEYVKTYMAIGWFISGVLLFSIAKNAGAITKWWGFFAIGNIIKNEIKDKTDQDVSKHEN